MREDRSPRRSALTPSPSWTMVPGGSWSPTWRSVPQPRCSGGASACRRSGGEGDRRREGLRAALPAALLARLRPDRASVLEGQGAATACRKAYPRGPDRGDGPSALGGHGSGNARVLRPLWLPHLGPTAMTHALMLARPSPRDSPPTNFAAID